MKVLISLLMATILSVPVAQSQSIRVVTEATAYSFLKDGKVAGAATEVVELSLRQAGLSDYRINLFPWARSYDMALKEPNVLIYLIARTPAREQQFKWVGEIMNIQYYFYQLKSRHILLKSLDDARDFTIGVMRDDVRHQYLKEMGFTRLVVSAQQKDNFSKLLRGQVDLVPLPDVDALTLCQEARFSCENLEKTIALDDVSAGLYMAYSHATPDAIVERTQLAFEKLRTAGIVKKIMEKNWIAPRF